MNDRHRELHALLASLGHASRFRIALHLWEGERSVGELALAVGLSQSCTTRHVQALERAGVVLSHRDGKRVLVGLARAQADLAGLLEWLGTSTPDTMRRTADAAASGRRAAAAPPARPVMARAARKPTAESSVLRTPLPEAPRAAQEQPPAPASPSGKDAVAQIVPDTPRRRLPDPIEDFLL